MSFLAAALCVASTSAFLVGGASATLPGKNGPLLLDSEVRVSRDVSYVRRGFGVSLDGKRSTLTPPTRNAWSLAVSPNSRQIAFTQGPSDQIWLAPRSDLSQSKQITFFAGSPPVQYGAVDAVFAPDGKSIFYSSFQGDMPLGGVWGIARVSTTSPHYPELLASDLLMPFSIGPDLSVSPNGRTLAFTVVESDKPQIRFLRIEDGLTWRFKAPMDALAGSFSPDGRRIAFRGFDKGNWEVFIGRVDGTGLRKLTTGEVAPGPPAFSPDGRRVAFRSGDLTTPNIVVLDLQTGKRSTVLPPGRATSISGWARSRVFEFRGYSQRRRVLNIKVFNPGLLKVQGPGIRTVKKKLASSGTYRIPVRWRGRASRSTARIAFRPNGALQVFKRVVIRKMRTRDSR